MSLRIKPGETLEWGVFDDSGDLTGTTIAASVERGSFRYDLTVTPVDLSVGSYTITALDTSTFPVGNMSADIKYTYEGTVAKSHTFTVHVDKAITQ